MAKAVSFGTVYQARDVAIAAAAQAGDATPVLNFLARYGNYLPLSQLNVLGQQFWHVPAADYENKTSYLGRLEESALVIETGTGERDIDALVGGVDPNTGKMKYRTIQVTLLEGEGIAELNAQIDAVKEKWNSECGGAEFEILSPVWRVY